jgi:hypothetical protein
MHIDRDQSERMVDSFNPMLSGPDSEDDSSDDDSEAGDLYCQQSG